MTADQRTFELFDALGTYVFVAVRDPAALSAAVQITRAVLDVVDASCSRFRPDSDLSRADRDAGRWVEVDPLLVAATEAACRAAEQTHGLVHPLLGRPMVQLGYDRDFASLSERRDDLPYAWPSLVPALDSWREIGLRPAAIRVPEDTALDLGSTGKAWAADVVAAGIEQDLGEPAVVSLGGDIRVAAPDGRPWRVAVTEHPRDPHGTVVCIAEGGLATSSTRVRRWTSRGIVRHHIIDPRTGLPTPEVWRAVTATGPTCTAANTASTAAVVMGEQAMAWLTEHNVTARLVAGDGRVTYTGDWPVDAPRRSAS
jgi:thiamine biosynthesis lipoprotein